MESMDDYKEELEASFKKIRVGDVVTGTVIDVTGLRGRRDPQGRPERRS